jgi:hypothetical protein
MAGDVMGVTLLMVDSLVAGLALTIIYRRDVIRFLADVWKVL